MTGLRILSGLGLVTALAAHPAQQVLAPGSPEEASLLELASRVEAELIALKTRAGVHGIPWHVDNLAQIPPVGSFVEETPPVAGSLGAKALELHAAPSFKAAAEMKAVDIGAAGAALSLQPTKARDASTLPALDVGLASRRASEDAELQAIRANVQALRDDVARKDGPHLTVQQVEAMGQQMSDFSPQALVTLKNKQHSRFPWNKGRRDKSQDADINKVERRALGFWDSVNRDLELVGLESKGAELVHKEGTGTFATQLFEIEKLVGTTNARLDDAAKEWEKINKRQQNFENGDKGIAYRMKVWTDEVENFYVKALKGIMKHNDISGDYSKKAPLTQELVHEVIDDEWGQIDKIQAAMKRRLKMMTARAKKKIERLHGDTVDESRLFKEMIQEFTTDMPMITEQVFNDLKEEFRTTADRAKKMAKQAQGQLKKGMKYIAQAVQEKDRQQVSFENTKQFTTDLLSKVKEFVETDQKAATLAKYQDQTADQIMTSAEGSMAGTNRLEDKVSEKMAETTDEERALADGVATRGEQRLYDFKTMVAENRAAMAERSNEALGIASGLAVKRKNLQDGQTSKLKLQVDARNDWERGAMQQFNNAAADWENSKAQIADDTNAGETYGNALEQASLTEGDEWKVKNKKFIEEKIAEMDELNRDQMGVDEDTVADYNSQLTKIKGKHIKAESDLIQKIIAEQNAAKAVKTDAEGKLDTLHLHSQNLMPDKVLSSGPDRALYKDKVLEMQNGLTASSEQAKNDIALKSEEYKAELKKQTDAYVAKAEESTDTIASKGAAARDMYQANEKSMRQQRIEYADLKEVAKNALDAELALKTNLGSAMDSAAEATNVTLDTMDETAKKVVDGAEADAKVDEQSAFGMMNRAQDPVWLKAEDSARTEEGNLKALTKTVQTGIAEQQKVASSIDDRVESYKNAVELYGPHSASLLDKLKEKIEKLQSDVKGYGPALTANAKANYDTLWADVEKALATFKERNGAMDTTLADDLYAKLKAMRPDNLDLTSQYDAMRSSNDDIDAITALRENFTLATQHAEAAAKDGLEMAERNAWQAASAGGEGMQEIAGMLDGIAEELHAKAAMASTVADGVGAKLMGKAMDSQRAAAKADAATAAALAAAEGQAQGLEQKAKAKVDAENTLAQNTDMSQALKGLLGATSQADKFFLTLQHGQERQKGLRAKWLATVVQFVSQLASTMDPDWRPPKLEADGEDAALGRAAAIAASAVSAGNSLVHAATAGFDPPAGLKEEIGKAGAEGTTVARLGNEEDKMVEGLVLSGVKAASKMHGGDVKSVGGLVNKLASIVAHLPSITKVAERMDDVGKDADAHVDFLRQHEDDPVKAAEGMENAMEREVKGVMSEEERLLAGQSSSTHQHTGIPSVHMMDLNLINQGASSSVAGDRASIMENMERSMAGFNDFAGREMTDEGNARDMVAKQETAAFNQVDAALGDVRREDGQALMDASTETQTAGRKLVELEKRGDLLAANVERLRDSAMAFHVAAPMDMKSAADLHAAAEALHKVDPSGDVAEATGVSLAQLPDQLRKEAEETPEDLDRITTLESMMQRLDDELH